MPPLFVDGVEINEVFVDGIEQDELFVDGVLVYSGKVDAGSQTFLANGFWLVPPGVNIATFCWCGGGGSGGSLLGGGGGSGARTITYTDLIPNEQFNITIGVGAVGWDGGGLGRAGSASIVDRALGGSESAAGAPGAGGQFGSVGGIGTNGGGNGGSAAGPVAATPSSGCGGSHAGGATDNSGTGGGGGGYGVGATYPGSAPANGGGGGAGGVVNGVGGSGRVVVSWPEQ